MPKPGRVSPGVVVWPPPLESLTVGDWGFVVGPDATGGGCVEDGGGLADGGGLVLPVVGGGFRVGGSGCLGAGLTVGRGVAGRAFPGLGLRTDAAEMTAAARGAVTWSCVLSMCECRVGVACVWMFRGTIVTVGADTAGRNALSVATGDVPFGSSAARHR